MDWSPSTWRDFEARQQPDYPDSDALLSATAELASYPPLVSSSDTDALKRKIAEAQAGQAFLLQGGDCAESFAEFSPANIDATSRLISEMTSLLERASGLPVITVGRLAGQFAKPRSTDAEAREGESLPVYRGDIVNGICFDPAARVPDPQRMFRAYSQAYATIARLNEGRAGKGQIFTSHEALLLPYEEALTRLDTATNRVYATSAHLLWIGDRTRFPGSAHVEFARGLANPLAIKCGPTLDSEILRQLLDILNPQHEPGRITLISRMGSDAIGARLPPLLRTVSAEGHPVLWSCDPMHGNTIKAANGYKTRPLQRILDEIRSFFAIALAERAWPGGIHVEMTGQNVTECTGGAIDITEQNLGDRYHTHCDPRLNPGQGLEVAELVAGLLPPRKSQAA